MLKASIKELKKNPQLLYRKLSAAVSGALQLDFDYCISPDTDAVSVEFHNLDTSKLLALEGYVIKDDRLVFENCACFIDQIYPLIDSMDKINMKYIEINTKFLNDVREIVKTLKREDVENSEARHLLNKNILFMDEASRHRILSILQEL